MYLLISPGTIYLILVQLIPWAPLPSCPVTEKATHIADPFYLDMCITTATLVYYCYVHYLHPSSRVRCLAYGPAIGVSERMLMLLTVPRPLRDSVSTTNQHSAAIHHTNKHYTPHKLSPHPALSLILLIICFAHIFQHTHLTVSRLRLFSFIGIWCVPPDIHLFHTSVTSSVLKHSLFIYKTGIEWTSTIGVYHTCI